ncbi:hypothetical protein FHS29_002362 [Saccharothrix tamanrassetensis]|uniref:Uncharacterized protein n=1 Tax=Saccharothrix tamanrassetensis TaxID=1051531 RepID=A0A841CER1_9PSEU|nr:hypothetical protein [Saccharothrix tamanrassetensis]MBB5955781.1 hypothetical protein [Saccharothrix tamanrassetensis]
MTLAEFVALFGDGSVRVLLDWDALGARGCPVDQVVSRSVDVLGDLFTVWYAEGAEYTATGARPLRVRDVTLSGDVRGERVLAIERSYRAAGRPVQLTLPVYALPQERYLLLDATHRSVAAFRSGLPVRLLLCVLRGPVDAAVLPDLRHH